MSEASKPSGFTWALKTSGLKPPEYGMRTIYSCPLCDLWQLDAGSHESRGVLEALIGEHSLGEHGFDTVEGFYRAVVAKREADEVNRWVARMAPFIALDDQLAGMRVGFGESLLGQVIGLHALDRTTTGGGCLGCDAGEYAEGPADWPCRTAALFIRRFKLDHEGIELP